MSSAADAHDTHDAHDAHAFTGEPVQVLSPDEPRTPGWVPLLGIALFTAAGVFFLATRGGPEATPEAAATAAAATAAPSAPTTAVALPARVEPPRPRVQPVQPAPAEAPTAPAVRRSPDQARQLHKAIEDAKRVAH